MQHESKGSKPRVKRENTNDSEYLRDKRGTPHFALDPLPSDPLLQGGREFSKRFSELSSSKGVWQPKK